MQPHDKETSEVLDPAADMKLSRTEGLAAYGKGLAPTLKPAALSSSLRKPLETVTPSWIRTR